MTCWLSSLTSRGRKTVMTYRLCLIDIALALSSAAVIVFVADDMRRSAAIPLYATAEKPARIVMITITTISSTRVNPFASRIDVYLFNVTPLRGKDHKSRYCPKIPTTVQRLALLDCHGRDRQPIGIYIPITCPVQQKQNKVAN